MKKLVGAMGAALMVLGSVNAFAQALPGNYMNMLFFQPGCATYTGTPPPQGALCIDTITGGMYVSNGTSFVIGGSEMLSANAGSGQTTATTTFFTSNGNSTNATTETINMELPLGPQPVIIRNLACWDSVAPGAGNSDAFTVRNGGPGFVAVGSMANSALTCSISGASATSCVSAASLTVALAANSVITIKDVTTGTPAARTIGCTMQLDEL